MQQTWSAFLQAPESGHGVQVYGEIDELADSVSRYVAAGFDRGAPALVVATPEHLGVFTARLESLGWRTDELSAAGVLATADAEATLGAIMPGGTLEPAAFDEIVGGRIDELAAEAGRPVRVFGEMVDVLCRRGQLAEAVALEELWTRAAQTRSFSLLCGYCVDVFDRGAQLHTLPAVCAHHSHILPAHRYARFARSVDRALDEVLGQREAGQLYMLLGKELQKDRVPAAQLILMWVSRNMPVLAERVLGAARAHYRASAA